MPLFLVLGLKNANFYISQKLGEKTFNIFFTDGYDIVLFLFEIFFQFAFFKKYM